MAQDKNLWGRMSQRASRALSPPGFYGSRPAQASKAYRAALWLGAIPGMESPDFVHPYQGHLDEQALYHLFRAQ
eukprot:7030959-Alexandrium_andersonii.AAC.1